MICKVRSLKLRIETGACFEQIITSRNEVFKDFESDMAGRIRMLGTQTGRTAKSNDTGKQTAGSQILNLQLKVKKIRSLRQCMHICEVLYKDILKRLTA